MKLNREDYSMVFQLAYNAAVDAPNTDYLEARVDTLCREIPSRIRTFSTLSEYSAFYKELLTTVHKTASVICELAHIVGDRDNYDTRILKLLYNRCEPPVDFLYNTTQQHGLLSMQVDKDAVMLMCDAEGTHPIMLMRQYDVIKPEEVESGRYERRNHEK